MTENFIKESISINYVSLIANDAGYTVIPIHSDFGTDLIIKEQTEIDDNGKTIYLDSGKQIEAQLKSTTKLTENGNIWEYNLRKRNYLNYTIRKNNPIPFVFIIFAIPEERNDWVNNDIEKMIVKKCAYYYIPDGNEQQFDTIVKLKIPKTNLLTKDVLKKIMEDAFNG